VLEFSDHRSRFPQPQAGDGRGREKEMIVGGGESRDGRKVMLPTVNSNRENPHSLVEFSLKIMKIDGRGGHVMEEDEEMRKMKRVLCHMVAG
jgi:hypothetical protein